MIRNVCRECAGYKDENQSICSECFYMKSGIKDSWFESQRAMKKTPSGKFNLYDDGRIAYDVDESPFGSYEDVKVSEPAQCWHEWRVDMFFSAQKYETCKKCGAKKEEL